MVAAGIRLPAWIYVSIMSAGVLICGHVFLALTRRKNRVSEWKTVQGQIEWLRTSERSSSSGFNIEASYSFQHDGKSYAGTAVSILDLYADILAAYDQDTAVRLQAAYRQNRAVTIHVCPYDLRKSVLLDISVVKALVGVGMLGTMALATLCFVYYFDTLSSISWIMGFLLGCAGYLFWTRWQLQSFPQEG